MVELLFHEQRRVSSWIFNELAVDEDARTRHLEANLDSSADPLKHIFLKYFVRDSESVTGVVVVVAEEEA